MMHLEEMQASGLQPKAVMKQPPIFTKHYQVLCFEHSLNN